jgi:alpha-ribazole phosphatase
MGNDERYKKWLESGCMADIPEGDSVVKHKAQTCREFKKELDAFSSCSNLALVIHGGNIMAILEEFAEPKMGFFHWHAPNCGIIACEIHDGRLRVLERVP